MKVPSFIGPSNVSQSPIADGERTINWYLETSEQPSATNRAVLYPTPGQTTWVTVTPDISTRALLSVNGLLHGVVGGTIQQYYETATATNRGTVAQDSNPAQLTYNGPTGNQLGIASGGNAYCMDLTTFVVTTELTGTATMIGMLDGYMVAFDGPNSTIRLSNLNDGTTWDPTQFATRSSSPDPWVAMLINDPDIWLVGELSTDVWFDAGAFPFPFEPRPGASFPFGTPAPFSLARAGDSVFWLSQTSEGAGIVVQAKGYHPTPISSKAVETAITDYQRTSKITDAEALTYQAEGHTFYVLSFPSANATWAYDLTTAQWHERGTWNSALNRFDIWEPRVHAYAFGKHLVGNRTTGALNVLDSTTASEADGRVIRRVRRAPAISHEQKWERYPRFQVFLDSGLGLASGQGSAPKVMLRTSDDGGRTWSNERLASAGARGEYGTLCYWTRLGAAQQRMFEVSVTDPIPWFLIDGFTS